MGDNKEKKDKKRTILIILIIILIILLLFLCYKLFFMNKNAPVPTGNVNIFEITCNDNCNCDLKDMSGDIMVHDKYTKWETKSELRIFENPVYNNDLIIAPESSNYYQFVVTNNTEYDVLYTFNFEEQNEYDVNMKYRLLTDNKYVAGDEKNWVKYDELGLDNIALDSEDSHTYYLQWKWFSSDKDNKIGKNINADYKLNASLRAVQQYDE